MTTSPTASATGLERLVRPEELFFSTTDRRGVIRSGNSVFVRVSGYPLGELVGAPHNLVRDPAMPAGAYRLMWERLLGGRPMGAYVRNLAKDGSHYWVFATVTPLGEGFLSVRMAPCGPLFPEVQRVYADALALERVSMAEHGLDRRAAAGVGALHIEKALHARGFATYDDFVREALAAEVTARTRLVRAAFARPRADGGIGEILHAASALEAMLGEAVDRLDSYRALADRLSRAAARVLQTAQRLDASAEAARTASAAARDSAPVLLNVATVMTQPMHQAVASLEGLAARLTSLRQDVASLRFRIALACLHNDMVASFAAEVADGAAPAIALHEIPLLCDALHEGVVEMAVTTTQVNTDLTQAAEAVEEAGARIDEFGWFLGQWRMLVLRQRASAAIGDLVGPIDRELADGRDDLALLASLGQECRAAVTALDVDGLEVQLTRIRLALN